MNNSILLHLLFVLVLWADCSVAQNKPSAPPGTIQYGVNKYIDARPVSNFMWREYLAFEADAKTRGYNDSKEYIEQEREKVNEPVRLANRSKIFDYQNLTINRNKEIPKDYTVKPRFRSFPVLGINRDSAEAYCAWRTVVVNAVRSGKISLKGEKIQLPLVKYQLPSVEDLNQSVLFAEKFQKVKSYEKEMKRIKDDEDCTILTFFPIKEITKEENFTYSKINKNQDLIGFRCSCIILDTQ